jgi:hypothetical protein
MLAFALLLAAPEAPLSLAQAETLVLAAPDIRTSVSEAGAKPFFESIERGPNGWRFTVKAGNGCATPNPCSSLIGHYTVDATTGAVVNLDAGEDGVAVSSPEMARLLASFRAH